MEAGEKPEKEEIVTEELAIKQMNRSLERLPDARARTRVLNYVTDKNTPDPVPTAAG